MTKARIVIFLVLAVTLVVSARPSFTQDGDSVFDQIRREHQWIEKHLHEPAPAILAATAATSLVRLQALTAAPQTIDVQHYRLQIRLNLDALAIAGTVEITAQTTAPTATINVDAFDNLSIDAVRVDNAAQNFRRKNNRLTINFANALPAGRPLTIAVDYHGT